MKKVEFIARYGEEAYQKKLEKDREYNKKYYQKNREKLLEQKKEYYYDNKEQILERNKEYHNNNKEQIAEYQKEYRKEYYEKNKAKLAERDIREYVENGNIEVIENYQLALADNFKGWNIHHRLETHTSDGIRRTVDLSRAELIALDMYWHRPANELVFMRKGEHMSLHNNRARM